MDATLHQLLSIRQDLLRDCSSMLSTQVSDSNVPKYFKDT